MNSSSSAASVPAPVSASRLSWSVSTATRSSHHRRRPPAADHSRLRVLEHGGAGVDGHRRERAVHGEQRCRPSGRERDRAACARDLAHARARRRESFERARRRDARARTVTLPTERRGDRGLDVLHREPAERREPEPHARVTVDEPAHDRDDFVAPVARAATRHVRGLQALARGRPLRRLVRAVARRDRRASADGATPVVASRGCAGLRVHRARASAWSRPRPRRGSPRASRALRAPAARPRWCRPAT